MNPIEMIWGAIGLLLTLMILSYLIGDNALFRFAANLFIGVTIGYLVVIIVNRIILPDLVTPLVTGTWIERLWMLIPIGLILLLVVGQLRRFSWMASLPLAYLAGLTAAIAIGGAVFGTLIPQSRAVIDAFNVNEWYAVPGQTWLKILDAAVMLVGVISTLSYFHFGKKFKASSSEEDINRPLFFETLSKVGQVFIGITLGAVFAGVFSSALLALLGRLSFAIEFVTKLFGGT